MSVLEYEMMKLVAVTPSASTIVHETVREVVNEALRDTDRGPVERMLTLIFNEVEKYILL